MQQRHTQPQSPRDFAGQRIFTASEVAEFEYCPLVWWYQEYEPLVDAGTDELFARMVEMEHTHGPQATALPEYQVIEQLLVRRGAFDEEQEQQRAEAAAEVVGMSDVEDEQALAPGIVNTEMRQLIRRIMLILFLVALAIFIAAFLLTLR